MQLSIHSIPLRGLNIALSGRDAWLKSAISQALADHEPNWSSLTARLEVNRVEKNVHLSGDLTVDFTLPCDRCAEPFLYHHYFDFTMNLVPLYKSDEASARLNKHEEEIELSREDLEFMYYAGDSINLGELLQEQCVLALPVQFFCQSDCLGLCAQCGTNLNQVSRHQAQCACKKDSVANLRRKSFDSLKPR